ncbi:MAG: NADH-quinone oxidoreductase subunit F [SAR202 cluster bacterium]|nr:NADH-quinone oxidoreductase subunit F [SAR202 cluster bacterium]
MPTYAELKARADKQWQDLTAGDRPWIRVGTALCGQAAGGVEVVEALKKTAEAKGIKVTVDEVGCIGMCYAEPLVDIQKPGESRLFFKNVSADDVPALLESYLVKNQIPTGKVFGYLGAKPIAGAPNIADMPQWKLQNRIALRNAGTTAPDDIFQYIANNGFAALNKALTEMKPADVIQQMIDSGLRGRGGAAFPTGTKWSFLVKNTSPVKYILCNCEEGDPGAYNDKGILESDPYTLVEGLLLAGYATGSSNGIIFVRHGHDGPIDRAEMAVKQAYENGLLGKNILGTSFTFNIEVALTGDSYVAGEETALMEAIEGHRSMPRSRPPFPAAFGVWGKPSNINNVKSLSYAPEIILKGAQWFSSIGVNKSKGTAIVCLSGAIKYPGWYEIPMGLSLSQVINVIGGGPPSGKKVKLLQTGGPLGGVLDANSLNIKIDFEEMSAAGAILGSGGIIIADEDTCAVDLTRVLVAFCQYESCGKCFPCRLGMTHLLEFVERITKLEGRPADLAMMESVGKNMQAGSLCGHGQLGFNPIRSALKFFGSDFKMHIEQKKCPTGSCGKPIISPRNTRPYAEMARDDRQPIQVASKASK